MAGSAAGPDLMTAAFLPSGQTWVRVSDQLRRMRRFLLCLAALPFVLVGIALAVFVRPWIGLLVLAVVVLVGGWAWVLIGRNFASWRYAERAEDLLISHGVLFRELVVVPYGRMQFVDLKAGPVDRKFGIATVQLHTAAAATDARIPGVPPAEADRLRDRLSALGEARSAGL